MLNVDPLNISRSCCSKMPLFSSVAGTGREKGPGGGNERVGLPHLRTSTVGASLGCCGNGMLDTAVDGNFDGMRQRSAHASLLKNNRVTFGVTYIICLVTASESGNDTSRMAPRMWMPLLFAACIRWDTGIRVFLDIPSL